MSSRGCSVPLLCQCRSSTHTHTHTRAHTVHNEVSSAFLLPCLCLIVWLSSSAGCSNHPRQIPTCVLFFSCINSPTIQFAVVLSDWLKNKNAKIGHKLEGNPRSAKDRASLIIETQQTQLTRVQIKGSLLDRPRKVRSSKNRKSCSGAEHFLLLLLFTFTFVLQ